MMGLRDLFLNEDAVANVVIQEVNGAAGSQVYTTLTSARYCTDDDATPGLSNPIPVPASGSFNFSFWKSHCLDISGTFTQVNNIRWYTDGTINWTLGTSGRVYVGTKDTGDNGCPIANYAQATGTVGTTGHDIWDAANGHPYYKDETTKYTEAVSYTSASPLTVDTTNYTTASKSKIVVTQVSVDDDATQGAQPAEVYTFRYDEI